MTDSPNKVHAVILDWAGTTVDFGCMAPAAVFIEVFKRHGVDIAMAEAREPMGANKRDHIAAVAGMDRVAKAWQEANGAPCTEADVDAMYEEFIPLQIDCIAEHADVIPGTLEAMEFFRKEGIKVGTTTGYSREMMDVLEPAAAKAGYKPDATVCSSDVPQGRPAPDMMNKNAELLGLTSMRNVVKIGDTRPDILEGRNAGAWTVGTVVTGNEIGMTQDEWNAVDPQTQNEMRRAAYRRLVDVGANYVVPGMGDVPEVVEKIERRLTGGGGPP